MSQPRPVSSECSYDAGEVRDESHEGNAEQAGGSRHPHQHAHLGVPADVGEALLEAGKQAGVVGWLIFRILDAGEREEHGEEADAVQEEVAGDTHQGHGVPAEGGTEDARHVELRGVEGDGVGEVFAGHQARDQGLVAGRVHGHGHAVQEGDQPQPPRR